MTSLIFTDAYLSKERAEVVRENFIAPYEKDIVSGELMIVEDEIKWLNGHYVVRIMIQKPQMEFEFD